MSENDQINAVTESRAVVLGGGGAVGVGWEAGFLTELTAAGVPLSEADAVVGTSAGSLVGSALAAGADLTKAMEPVAALGRAMTSEDLARGARLLLEAMNEVGAQPDPVTAIRTIGSMITSQPTSLDEDAFVGLLGMDGVAAGKWPDSFRCTALDIDAGTLTVWSAADDVPLERAIASSCSAPSVFPLITINGRRYIDGGVLSHLNAPVAEAERVLAVSCFPIEPAATETPGLGATIDVVRAELAAVRARGTALHVVEPDAEVFALGGNGTDMMNPELAGRAYELGRAQARRELTRIADFWAG